jgi:hypothetical protein
MNRNQLARERAKYANRSGKLTQGKVNGIQSRLWLFLLDGILSLAVNESSKLVFTTANQRKAGKIVSDATLLFQSESKSLMGYITKRLLRLFGINKDYFSKAGGPKPIRNEKGVLERLMMSYGYDSRRESLISGGYFSQIGNGGQVSQKIAQSINQAISSEMSLKDFREQFHGVIVNPNGLGLVQAHYSRFTHDIYMDFDRLTGVELAKETGLTHAIYAGTEVEDTRGFCEARLNRVYTLEEIETWNSDEWKGKRPGVDVKQALGGYNCRHILNWVSEALAKEIAKRRGIEIDSYDTSVKLG